MARLGLAGIDRVRHHAAAPTVDLSRGDDPPSFALRPHPKRLGPSDPDRAAGPSADRACSPKGEACPMRFRLFLAGFASLVACGTSGCATTGAARAVAENPITVPSGDFETVWNAAVVAVDEYFDIASEDRVQRKIVTQPKSGATLLEPWEGDSVGFRERFESTLQSIRRFAIVTVQPSPTGQGWAVRVEVRKELEDLLQPDRQSIGRAVFNNQYPLNRTREVVGPVQAPAFWIPRGRDPKLEQAILAKIRESLFL
jgi:hypothetical protein